MSASAYFLVSHLQPARLLLSFKGDKTVPFGNTGAVLGYIQIFRYIHWNMIQNIPIGNENWIKILIENINQNLNNLGLLDISKGWEQLVEFRLSCGRGDPSNKDSEKWKWKYRTKKQWKWKYNFFKSGNMASILEVVEEIPQTMTIKSKWKWHKK